MYEWYFGKDKAPDDERNALAEIIAGIATVALLLVAFVVLLYRWFVCLI